MISQNLLVPTFNTTMLTRSRGPCNTVKHLQNFGLVVLHLLIASVGQECWVWTIWVGTGSGISHPLQAHKIGKNLNIHFNFYMYQIILSLDNEKQDILTFGYLI